MRPATAGLMAPAADGDGGSRLGIPDGDTGQDRSKGR